MTEAKTKSQVRVKCPECGYVFLPSLKEKQSRAGRASRRKGANFERKIAKDLAKWWNQNIYNYDFKRTPMSGGSVLKDGFDMAGDICTNAPNWIFHVEVKNQPKSFTGLHNWFSDRSKLWQWLTQAVDDCPQDKIPILIFNRFDMPTYCAAIVGHGYIENSDFDIMDTLMKLNMEYFVYKNKLPITIVIWQFKDMLRSNPENWK